MRLIAGSGDAPGSERRAAPLIETIDYRTDCTGITARELAGFFHGWPDPPSPETHLSILQGSDHMVLAVDSGSGRVVGFVNAITDGVLSAYIPLLEVLSDWRGHGIARELVSRLRTALDGYYMIDLVCDPDLERFYRPLGFQRLTAMGIRDYQCQSGQR